MKKLPRPLQALVLLMVFSAAVHLFLLALHIFLTNDASAANFFLIIGLDKLVPSISHMVSVSWSLLIAALCYGLIYIFFTNEKSSRLR